MMAALRLIVLVLSLSGCASAAATRTALLQGERSYFTNASQVDRSPRPGLGVVVNRGNTSWLTVLVFPGRYALEGRQDGLLVPNPTTGKLQLVREPSHRFALGPAIVHEAPTEYWLWLPPQRDYTFLLIAWQGLLFPRVLDMWVQHIHPDGRVFDQRQSRPLGNITHLVDWKLEVTR